MLYQVEMTVNIPPNISKEAVEAIKIEEKSYAQDLQKQGKWLYLWRVVGRYENLSIFDVESNDALHDLLSNLPLFPYMDIRVTALARHPSAL